MTDIARATASLVARLRDGDGHSSAEQRRAVLAGDTAWLPPPLAALLEKVMLHAHRVSDADVTAVREAGLTEDQIFELVVCAAVGQTKREWDVARAALQDAGSHAPRNP